MSGRSLFVALPPESNRTKNEVPFLLVGILFSEHGEMGRESPKGVRELPPTSPRRPFLLLPLNPPQNCFTNVRRRVRREREKRKGDPPAFLPQEFLEGK